MCCCASTAGSVVVGLVIAGRCACAGARALWEMDRSAGCRRASTREAGLARRDSALSDEMSEVDIFSRGCNSPMLAGCGSRISELGTSGWVHPVFWRYSVFCMVAAEKVENRTLPSLAYVGTYLGKVGH